jgi:thiamine biosynthesis lipoprotein
MSQIDHYLYKLTKKLSAISLRGIGISIWQIVKKSKWILLFVLCLSLGQIYRNRLQLVTWQGEALGKSYQVDYWIKQATNYSVNINTLLDDLSQNIALDHGGSVVEEFNQYGCDAFYLAKPFLYELVDTSKIIYKATNGIFDPTIAPLVKLWKGCQANFIQPDSNKIKDLRTYISLDYIVVNKERIKKLKEKVSLDVSGLLHGYAIDTIADFLKERGTQDLCIKMGKLTVAYGNQPKTQGWFVQEPLTIQQHNTLLIETMLCDQALVIKQQAKDGDSQKMALIIDPTTGAPGQHSLLGVAVFAKHAVMADAYATAILAKGVEFAKNLASTQQELEVWLVYEDVLGQIAYYASEGLTMENDPHKKQLKLMICKQNTIK